MIKKIKWDPKKSAWLKKNRGIGFEECVVLIEAGKIIDSIDNPSAKYSQQKIFVLEIGGYVYLVPYIENDEEIFMKTLYRSRKFKKIYLDKTSK